MDCEAIRRQLAAWSDGELDPHSRADVDRHLEDCADCRVDGQGLRELDERLRRASAPRRLAADCVAQRVIERLAADVPFLRPEPRRVASAWRSQLLALAAGFLLAVIVFRPWHQKVPTGPMLLVHPSAPGRVSPVTQLVAATGPVEVRGPDAADWCSVASATDFRCPKGTSVRTGPSVQCELQTASGGTVRLNDDTQIKLAADDTIEVDCGQIWCSAPAGQAVNVLAPGAVSTSAAAQGAQAAKSWSLCCPADTCVLAGVEPGGGVQVGTTAGEVDVRTPTERRRLRPGESVSIVGGSIVQADNATDPLLATRWTQPLLIGKGFDNHDLADYVERLVAGLGRSDQSAAYEGDLRSLGPYAALPLIRYVRSPRSQADAALRLAVLRIACDTAPCWTIGELAELLADPDAESRYLAAGALERLTGRDEGRAPAGWRDDPSRCQPTVDRWRRWWLENQDRYRPPRGGSSI